jgi:gamma-glutamyltranspeptidase
MALAAVALIFGALIGQVTHFGQGENNWTDISSSTVQPSPVEEHKTAEQEKSKDNMDEVWAKIKKESLIENLHNGAVATDDGRCSELGKRIMAEQGGNAIDAAVAVVLCLGIVNPAGSTPGGGAFVLLHADAHPERTSRDFIDARQHTNDDEKEGEKQTYVIDCRETAPLEATMDMFDGQPDDASWTGPLASAVPGQLHCLELMHSRHGSLPWKQVIDQVVPLARDGMEVTPYLAHAINLKSSKAKIFKNEALARLMTKNHDGETLLQTGDILANPALADTLQAIADGGIDALYKGERAAKIEQEFQELGGILSAKDFASYRAVLRDPLVTQPGELKGFTMVGVPPASSGGCVVIGAARFLAGYQEAFAAFEDTLSEHRLIEALKHSYSIRMSLSDPAFFANITAQAVNDMVEGDFMEKLRQKTKDDYVLPISRYGGEKWGIFDETDVAAGEVVMSEEGHDNRRRRLRREDEQSHRNLKGFQYLNDHGTTHLAIIDKDGNAVTMTTTINTYFGSGIVSPSTGIIFNSQVRFGRDLKNVVCCIYSQIRCASFHRWMTLPLPGNRITMVWSPVSPIIL